MNKFREMLGAINCLKWLIPFAFVPPTVFGLIHYSVPLSPETVIWVIMFVSVFAGLAGMLACPWRLSFRMVSGVLIAIVQLFLISSLGLGSVFVWIWVLTLLVLARKVGPSLIDRCEQSHSSWVPLAAVAFNAMMILPFIVLVTYWSIFTVVGAVITITKKGPMDLMNIFSFASFLTPILLLAVMVLTLKIYWRSINGIQQREGWKAVIALLTLNSLLFLLIKAAGRWTDMSHQFGHIIGQCRGDFPLWAWLLPLLGQVFMSGHLGVRTWAQKAVP